MKKRSNLVKGKDIIGLKVITWQKGQNIQEVEELVYDPQKDKVTALVVDSGGWFSDAKVILFEDVKSIGKDAVMVESNSVLKKASQVKESIRRILREDTYLTQTTIITEEGTELGKISDIFFDAATGEVSEYEVSQGMKNLESGKKRVAVSDVLQVGEDATIVRDTVEAKLDRQAQEQGLQGAVNRGTDSFDRSVSTAQEEAPELLAQAGSKLHAAAAKTKNELGELTANAQDKLQRFQHNPPAQPPVADAAARARRELEKTPQTGRRAKTSVLEKTEELNQDRKQSQHQALVGRYLTINILDPHDNILAKRGDMVTNALLRQAEVHGIMDQVLDHTTQKPVDHRVSKQGEIEINLLDEQS